MISIIAQLKILLIFQLMITRVWIKWRNLSISELSCNNKGNLLIMIRLYWFQTKRGLLFAFINRELGRLEMDKDVKLCTMLSLMFMMKTLFRLRRLSICHIKLFKLKKNKNFKVTIMMRTTTVAILVEQDEFWKKKRKRATLKTLICHIMLMEDIDMLSLVKLISKQPWRISKTHIWILLIEFQLRKKKNLWSLKAPQDRMDTMVATTASELKTNNNKT